MRPRPKIYGGLGRAAERGVVRQRDTHHVAHSNAPSKAVLKSVEPNANLCLNLWIVIIIVNMFA